MSRLERLAVAVVLVSALAFAGCGASAPAPDRDNRHIFFFEPDRDWMEKHPQYVGDYGVIHYRDKNDDGDPDFPTDDNGDGKPDFPDEIIKMTPRFYPTHLIHTSWSYTPRA